MFEELLANPAVVGGLTVIGRNIFGWAMNSLKDGKIQDYEWKQLLETVVKLGGMALFLWFGINAIVPGIDPTQATGLAALIDVLRSEFKRK